MSVADNLRMIAREAEPLLEEQLDIAERLADIRDAAAERGLNWSALKALLVAKVKDAADGGDRVEKMTAKADLALTYAGMLHRTIVAENRESPPQSEAAAETLPRAAAPTAETASPPAPAIISVTPPTCPSPSKGEGDFLAPPQTDKTTDGESRLGLSSSDTEPGPKLPAGEPAPTLPANSGAGSIIPDDDGDIPGFLRRAPGGGFVSDEARAP